MKNCAVRPRDCVVRRRSDGLGYLDHAIYWTGERIYFRTRRDGVMGETIEQRRKRKFEQGRQDALAGRDPRDTERAYIEGYEFEYDSSRAKLENDSSQGGTELEK